MEKSGLRYWSGRALEELANVSHNFDPEPVHDLRVALRRCRSMADGFRAIDPDPGWKQLKKLAKELFSRLGDLRDMQVMEEWVTRLGTPEDPLRQDLLRLFASRESELKAAAQSAVQAFDQKHWDSLTQRLALRTQAISLEGMAFQHIARERLEQAYNLHRQALRNRTQVSFHRLRIGLKKFRYTVENFLPQRHAKWGADLRELQDLLGEIHDLDVLAALLRTRHPLLPQSLQGWQSRVREERQQRLDKYREKMLGSHALWHVWRADLPEGVRLQEAALARLRAWGKFLDPDVRHSNHVTRLAIQLYDGLAQRQVIRGTAGQRRILELAALLHDVGLSRGNHAHHKQSYRMIRKISAPLGWTPQQLREAGAVARYHRGALPRAEHKCLRRLPASTRSSITRLAGVLRLANSFDLSHDGKVRQLHVESNNGTVIVHGEGYSPSDSRAERIAAARHLLETTCRVAVLVRPM